MQPRTLVSLSDLEPELQDGISVCQSTTLVQTEISKHVLEGLFYTYIYGPQRSKSTDFCDSWHLL